jgi:hypothetical protein
MPGLAPAFVCPQLQYWEAFTNALYNRMALARAEEDDANDQAAGGDDNDAGDQGGGDQLDEDGNENAAALAAGADLAADLAAQEDRDADLADLGDDLGSDDQLDEGGNENAAALGAPSPELELQPDAEGDPQNLEIA